MTETLQDFLSQKLLNLSEDITGGEYGNNNDIDIYQIETILQEIIQDAEILNSEQILEITEDY